MPDPTGGTPGQILTTDGTDMAWADPDPLITVGTTAPLTPSVGDVWIDTN